MLKISSNWLLCPEAQSLFDMLSGAGHRAFAVGGCVRNELLGVPVADVDIASDAHPDKVISLATKAGFQAIPTGLAHGTVTVVIGGQSYEVTTFRRDCATDGRHAVVAFSDDIVQDASRRDFTINALYCDAKGNVVDPLGGLDDLQNRRLRFVGDAAQRIKEDYLRALRYFRFHAQYFHNVPYDAEALVALAAHQDGIFRLSEERITSEMKKLLQTPYPDGDIAQMQEIGLWPRLVPAKHRPDLGRLRVNETKLRLSPEWLPRLVFLTDTMPVQYWRFSRKEAKLVTALYQAVSRQDKPHALGYSMGPHYGLWTLAILNASEDVALSAGASDAVLAGAVAKFPVSARDLPKNLVGPEIGARLRALEKAWIASEFSLSKDALLDLPESDVL